MKVKNDPHRNKFYNLKEEKSGLPTTGFKPTWMQGKK